jgi:hypothetical protein
MSYSIGENPTVLSEARLANTLAEAMARVYLWMAAGLGVTAVVAILVAQSDGIVAAVFGRWYVDLGLIVAQLALVVAISGNIWRLAPGTALSLFFLYSALMGLTLSVVFLVFDLGTIGRAFGVTAVPFTAMAIIGLTTKKDLTGVGPLLLASLFGLIVAGSVNFFFQSGVLEWIVSFAGVVVFMGLTAHDSQAIKAMTAEALADGDEQVVGFTPSDLHSYVVGRVGVLGALNLYLDFLNLLLFILRILGEVVSSLPLDG